MDFLFYAYTSFSPNLISVFISFYLISSITFSVFYSCGAVYGVTNFYAKSYNYLAFILAALVISLFWSDNVSFLSFNGLLSISDHNIPFEFIILSISLFCIMISHNYAHHQKIFQHEYIGFIIFSILGLNLLCYSNDLLLLYVALELQSLAFYLLAAFN
jgi:NADH:ubiquinone oxidoreductase subunit 2 (subunit N)